MYRKKNTLEIKSPRLELTNTRLKDMNSTVSIVTPLSFSNAGFDSYVMKYRQTWTRDILIVTAVPSVNTLGCTLTINAISVASSRILVPNI